MKNFNAVSHNRARLYFRIQHDRGEVRARRVYLNVHSVTRNVVDTDDLLSFGDGNAAGRLETTPKADTGRVLFLRLYGPRRSRTFETFESMIL